MSRFTASSRGSSTKSSRDSTFSRNSKQSYQTNLTSCSDTLRTSKQSPQAPVFAQQMVEEPEHYSDESLPRSSASSIATYASTNASEEDLSLPKKGDFPPERSHCFVPDAIPSNPPDFAKLFPSTRRLLIQHDDSTSDGNMNVRVDTEVKTKRGNQRKMTLFHMKMRDLNERQFSIRRYCRESGREVVSTKRQYVKPLPPNLKRERATTADSLPQSDSGYESDDEDDDSEESLKQFMLQSNVKATIPTESIKLEFSNYAQVIVEPNRNRKGKEYGFEYWGEEYSWKRRALRDEGEIIFAFDLMNTRSGDKIASIMPDALSQRESDFEASQGGWVPASSMRISQPTVSDDLADVIVATGLVSLIDDCLYRRKLQEQQ